MLLDLALPDSFGLESLARWLPHYQRVPIIVLTGHNATIQAGKRPGKDRFSARGRVVKPVERLKGLFGVRRRIIPGLAAPSRVTTCRSVT